MTDHERQARTGKGMGFPSMEGALMSISFLIFAVFLIKLVQVLLIWVIYNLENMRSCTKVIKHQESIIIDMRCDQILSRLYISL